MRFYVSTSFLNQAAAVAFAAELVRRGHELTCAWWDLAKRVNEVGLDGIARREIQAICACEIFVLLCPGRLGSHVELGAAIALATPLIIVVGEPEPHTDCVFYALPTVRRCVTVEEALAIIDLQSGTISD